ncbi:MAG: hypothetical protein HOJ24_10025 [Rhodobacteraceae bacterium]|nr:hypothetical protein [Paracoccaceae bacterium]
MTDPELANLDAIAMFGTSQPTPEQRKLTAGSLTATWEQGALRNVCYDGVEVLRGIAFLSRDGVWGNNAAKFTNLIMLGDDTHFQLSFDLVITNDTQLLNAVAKIEGNSGGKLSFSVFATAASDFLTNRTGLTILHPLENVVGQPVEVTHTDGTKSLLQFPENISPGQPIFDIRTLTHQVGQELTATILMDGAKFEMEDHRNWMDASFKTYSGSLLDPWPYTIKRGENISQTVTLTVSELNQPTKAPAPKKTISVSLGGPAEALPDFGTALSLKGPADVLEVSKLLDWARPAYLVGRMDGRHPDLDTQAADMGRIVRATNIPLELEMILPGRGSAIQDIAKIALALKHSGVVPTAIIITQNRDMASFQPGDPRPPGLDYSEMALAARAAFPGIPIGGGVVAFFTELNRLPVPIGLFDFVVHTICPAVHAADDQTVMENLEAAKWIFASTRQMIGTTKYQLGPSWISSRVNPYGPSVLSNSANERSCLVEEDPRQFGLFGAAWLLGLAAAAAQAGLSSVGLASISGPQGLIRYEQAAKPQRHPTAKVVPAYHVLAGLAARRSNVCISTTCDDPRKLATLAIETDAGPELWLANLTAEKQLIRVDGLREKSEIHSIDSTQFSAVLEADFMAKPGMKVDGAAGFTLAPYATARIGPVI